jgi:hypothetical protein
MNNIEKIDISSVHTVWLTSDKTKHRHAFVEDALSKLNFSNVTKISGRICNPYTIGIAETHLQALSLYKDYLLVLEDDIQLNPNYKGYTTFDIDKDTDALYLGTSTFGRIQGNSHAGACIAISNGTYLKPINMLSMHAILYTSSRYVQHTIKELSSFISNPIGGIDDKIAQTMSFYNVNALRVPMFYQADGHSEQATLTPLVPIF